jgi:hypothetical protein
VDDIIRFAGVMAVVLGMPMVEERVDFAERLLAREREPGPLLSARKTEGA